jgi:hypothetical protein
MNPPSELPGWLIEAMINGPEGCSHLAWRRPDALAVLQELASTSVAVLGGDVLVLGPQGFTHSPTGDNWTCNLSSGESWTAYAARSRRKAHDYIHRYREQSQVAYAFVFRDKPSAQQLIRSRA